MNISIFKTNPEQNQIFASPRTSVKGHNLTFSVSPSLCLFSSLCLDYAPWAWQYPCSMPRRTGSKPATN